MKTVNFKRISLFSFFILFLLGGLFFLKGTVFATECPIHTIGLSHDTYTPANLTEVKALQSILSQDNSVWPSRYHVNGVFDWATVGSLHRFQNKYHLPSTGVLDKATINKLCNLWEREQQIKEQIQTGQIAEDPVSGTLTVNKNTVDPNKSFTITIVAKDKQGVDRINLYYNGTWHAQACNKEVVCQKTFELKESQRGIYNYYGFVVGYKLNGAKEGRWTIPIKAVVKVGVQNHLLYPQNNNNGGLNRWGIQSQEENQGNYISGKTVNLSGIAIENNKKPSIINPSSKIYGNSGIPNKGNNFTMSNPSVSVTKSRSGNYGINWFVSDAPTGLITVKIVDQNGKKVAEQTLMNEGEGVFFNGLNAKLDSNKKYTFVISGGGKSGSFNFNGADLSKGAAIINNTIVTQYSTRNHYIYGISTGVSPDGKTMTVDLNISGAMGPAQTKNIKKLVVKDSNGKIIKTITGDWTVWGPILAGKKITIPGIDVTQTGSLSFELYDKNNNLLEKDQLTKDNQGGFVQLANVFQGAQGWGSVYDPKVTYYAQGTPSGTSITLHFDAKGAGAVVLVHPDGTKETLKGSNATLKNMKKGETGYLMFYDSTGKLAHIESIQRDSRGNYKNNPVDIPGVYYQKCGGGSYYIGGSKSKILKITVNGKEVTLKGPSLGKSSQYSPGTKIVITFQDPNTEAIYTTTYTIGSNHNIQSNALINIKGASQPQAKPVSSTETKSGIKVAGYSDGMNNGFAQISGFSNLTIDKMTFGYGPYDSSGAYQQTVRDNFKKKGTLPPGDYYFNGGALHVHVFHNGTAKILYDKTEKVKPPTSVKEISQFLGTNGNDSIVQATQYALSHNDGKHLSVFSPFKVYSGGTSVTISVNPTADTVTVTIGGVTKTFNSIQAVKDYLETVSKNNPPKTNKGTNEGTKEQEGNSTKENNTDQNKSTYGSGGEIPHSFEGTTKKPKTKKLDYYEKALNSMLSLGIISPATYEKKLEEHKKSIAKQQSEKKVKVNNKGTTKKPKTEKLDYYEKALNSMLSLGIISPATYEKKLEEHKKSIARKHNLNREESTYGPGGEIPHSFEGNTEKPKTDETPSPTYGPGGEIPNDFLYRIPTSGSSNLFRDFLGFIFGVNTK